MKIDKLNLNPNSKISTFLFLIKSKCRFLQNDHFYGLFMDHNHFFNFRIIYQHHRNRGKSCIRIGWKMEVKIWGFCFCSPLLVENISITIRDLNIWINNVLDTVICGKQSTNVCHRFGEKYLDQCNGKLYIRNDVGRQISIHTG
jgi:hypothetical protein